MTETLHEPVVTTDKCPYCTHSWHGLPCRVDVRAHGLARHCTCPSAIPEFRGVNK